MPANTAPDYSGHQPAKWIKYSHRVPANTRLVEFGGRETGGMRLIVSEKAFHEGHSGRLRERFLLGDAASRSDAALLELLLIYAIPQKDVEVLARNLLSKFGSLENVFAASIDDLCRLEGIKENSAVLFKLIEVIQKRNLLPSLGTVSQPKAKPDQSDQPIETSVLRPLFVSSSGNQTEAPKDKPPPVPMVTQRTVPLPLNATNAVIADDSAIRSRLSSQRKLQVSSGYLFDTSQLARVLTFIDSKSTARKITSAELIEGSGLSARQIESLVSMGSALGLITPRTQVLAPFGKLVMRHDIFLDSATTLEFCHFLAAGNPRYLVWFEVFNDLLVTQQPMAQPGWTAWLRQKLFGLYSEASLIKHVAHEVRFILDAYLNRNFKKLNLLTKLPEKTYAVNRCSGLQTFSLAAMIYQVGQRSGAGVVPFGDLHNLPGSPGLLFALDANTLRQMVEVLHQREWLRFEVRHGLDQVRLTEGFAPLEFLAASYENRTPQPQAKPTPPVADQLLL